MIKNLIKLYAQVDFPQEIDVKMKKNIVHMWHVLSLALMTDICNCVLEILNVVKGLFNRLYEFKFYKIEPKLSSNFFFMSEFAH